MVPPSTDPAEGSRVSPVLDVGKSNQSYDNASKDEDGTYGFHRRHQRQ
jgi:hypothetical protein